MASYSKGEIVDAAYDELALAGYVFDLEPEERQAAVRRLDMMMAEWNGRGIRLGYPLSSAAAQSDLNASSNLPDMAVEAVVCNLAIRLAPGNGKQVAAETKAIAREGYSMLLARATQPPQMNLPRSMPMGAGNKPWAYFDRVNIITPAPDLAAGTDNEIDL